MEDYALSRDDRHDLHLRNDSLMEKITWISDLLDYVKSQGGTTDSMIDMSLKPETRSEQDSLREKIFLEMGRSPEAVVSYSIPTLSTVLLELPGGETLQKWVRTKCHLKFSYEDWITERLKNHSIQAFLDDCETYSERFICIAFNCLKFHEKTLRHSLGPQLRPFS